MELQLPLVLLTALLFLMLTVVPGKITFLLTMPSNSPIHAERWTLKLIKRYPIMREETL